jgi:hypothetical protein
VIYVHVTRGEPAWEGESGPTTETEHEAEAAFPAVRGGLISGTYVQVGEVAAVVSADRLGVVPTTAGRLVVNGKHHQVVKVDRIQAGEHVAAWLIQADG